MKLDTASRLASDTSDRVAALERRAASARAWLRFNDPTNPVPRARYSTRRGLELRMTSALSAGGTPHTSHLHLEVRGGQLIVERRPCT